MNIKLIKAFFMPKRYRSDIMCYLIKKAYKKCPDLERFSADQEYTVDFDFGYIAFWYNKSFGIVSVTTAIETFKTWKYWYNKFIKKMKLYY